MLTDEQRKELWKQINRELSDNREPMSLDKFELKEVIELVDTAFDEVLEVLRGKITSRAQAALPERMWLRITELVVSERQKAEAKTNPSPKDVREAAIREVVKNGSFI